MDATAETNNIESFEIDIHETNNAVSSATSLELEIKSTDTDIESPQSSAISPQSNLKSYDFATTITNISLMEKILISFYMLTFWLMILIYLIWNVSTNKPKQIYAAFVFFGFVCSVIYILFNPVYFQKFTDRHKPINIQQISILKETMTMNPINPSLQVNNNDKINVNNTAETQINETSNKQEHDNNSTQSTYCTSFKRIMIRLFTLGIAILILFIPSDKDNFALQSFVGGIFILIIMIFNLYFVSHCILYYRKLFWKYNFIIWILLTFLLIFLTIATTDSGNILLYCVNSILIFLFHCALCLYVSRQRKKHLLHQLDPDLFEDTTNLNIQWNWGGSIKDIDNEMFIENELNAATMQTCESISAGEIEKTETTLRQITERKKKENKRQSRKKFIKCCFGQIKCEFKTCLRIQNFFTSISFWLFMAFTWITGVGGNIQGALPSALFIFLNLWYNPLFYSNTCINIRNRKWCCHFKKYMYYFIVLNGFIWGIIINMIAVIIYVSYSSNRKQYSSGSTAETLATWFWGGFFFVSGTYFFAAAGYSFYQIPVQFVISHLIGACLCFIFPVSIFLKNLNLAQYEEGDRLYGIWISVVAVGIFLALSGSSCSYWRFRKSLIETQSYISGHKKGLNTKDFPLTILMVTTFMAAIIDFITDAIWILDKNTWSSNARPVFQIIGYVLFSLQILIQMLSICNVMSTLKKRLKFKKEVYLSYVIKTKADANKCFCVFGYAFYPIIWIFYSICILLLSMVLAVTKLLAIKQIREWWLSWIISDYKQAIRKHSMTSDDEIQIQIKKMNDLASYKASGLWCWYYKIESCTPVWMLKYSVNSSVYNNYLISELIVESIPLLLLNIVNSYYSGWTFIAYCSGVSSSLYILYSLLKVAYYVGYLDWDLTKFVL